jgi:hypothetical protein
MIMMMICGQDKLGLITQQEQLGTTKIEYNYLTGVNYQLGNATVGW